MQGNRRVGTAPEIELRRALYAQGYRYRKDALVRAEGTRVRPDIVFFGRRVAVFVDGCFWHGCPDHCRMPGSNVAYWEAKIARNRARPTERRRPRSGRVARRAHVGARPPRRRRAEREGCATEL